MFELAGELGYEIAQSNAAYILDELGEELTEMDTLDRHKQARHQDRDIETETQRDTQRHRDGETETDTYRQTHIDRHRLTNREKRQTQTARVFLIFKTKHNCCQAMRWYRRAAQQSNVHAELRLGDYYYFGLSGEADDAKVGSCARATAGN